MKTKKIFYIAAAITLTGLLIAGIRYFADNNFRKQIPGFSEADASTPFLKQQLSEAYKTARRNPTARNIGRLGMAYHSNSLYDKAAGCYKLAVRKNKAKWVWNYYLGYLDKEMGDNAGVIENFSEVTGKNPGNWLAWYYLGEGYQASGQNDKAEQVYNRIISDEANNKLATGSSRKDHYPLGAYARFQLAGIYMNNEKKEEAEKMLKDLIGEQLSFGQAYRLLGSIYNKEGKKELADHYVTRAGDLRIYTPPVDTIADILAHISRSDLFLLKQVDDAEKAGYPEYSLQLILEGLAAMPDNKFVVSKGIKILLLRGLDKMALPLIDKHLNDFGDDINELRMVADILLKRSLYEQALRYYNQALKLKPGDLDLQLGSILCMGSTGSKKQALEAMDALESANNSNTKVLTDGVYTLVLIGEREKGLAYLNHLKQIAPSDPKVLQLWGLAMQQSGDSLKALALYERSFKENPDDFTTARYLGDLLMQMRLWKKAEEHFRISLQHFPNEPYMLEKMGNLLVLCPDSKLLNAAEGREYSERAFIHKSSPPMTVISAGHSLSKAYALLGEKEKAYKYMNITINLARREKAPPQVLENLGKELETYR